MIKDKKKRSTYYPQSFVLCVRVVCLTINIFIFVAAIQLLISYDLMKINECKQEKMFNVKSIKRSFSKNDILSNISNFYMTDSVSRNSPTMSSCSLEINHNI